LKKTLTISAIILFTLAATRPVPGLLRSARNDGAGDAARWWLEGGFGYYIEYSLKKITQQ
jgi:hypothetical protein